MLIDKCGLIESDKIKGVVTKDKNIMLDDNQFFQWSPTEKRLELWEGKTEMLQLKEFDTNIYRITYWNSGSVIAFIN